MRFQDRSDSATRGIRPLSPDTASIRVDPGSEQRLIPAVRSDWKCRACHTRNPSGWQVCRACNTTRSGRTEWLRSGVVRPILVVVAAAIAISLGIWVVGAWTAIVGVGVWIVPVVLFWTLLVLSSAVVVWLRQR